MRRCLLLPLLFALSLGAARAAEVIPPAPKAYFNDYAGVVGAGVAQALNGELDQFERQTSNQIVVAVYPKMQSDSSIEDYTQRVAQSWHAGQKGKDNGAVLFVFVQDHKMYIEVGYGLESTLTDATCSQIVKNEISPRFRQGDFSGGLTAAVNAMMAATRGEYQGNGRTVYGQGQQRQGEVISALRILLLLAIFILWSILRSRQHVVYRGSGPRTLWGGGGPWIFPGGFGGGGGGGGGGGFSGGGFSGGGGGFGGGGAGGSW